MAVNLSSKEVQDWLNPWPIKLKRKRRWGLAVIPISHVAKFTCLWKDGNGDQKTIGWWADRAAKGGVADDRQHYLHMLARFQVPVMSSLTVMAMKKDGAWCLIDGNYHSIACMMIVRNRYQGLKCRLRWAGVLYPLTQGPLQV